MKNMIEFIEQNLIFNKNKEGWAYFEFMPYNYSFLSLDQKEQLASNLEAMFGRVKSDKIKIHKLGTERSMASIGEASKRYVTGENEGLKEIAYNLIDAQIELFEAGEVERQIDYRYYVGFKLSLPMQKLTAKNILKELKETLEDFVHSVNTHAFGDVFIKSESTLRRHLKQAKFVEKNINRYFNLKPLNHEEIGYIVSHINFATTEVYEDYHYYLPQIKHDGQVMLKKYDVKKLDRVEIDEKGRHLEVKAGDKTTYVSYFVLEDIVDDVAFGTSEVLYDQQELEYPVDVSINVEVIGFKKALPTVVKKKKDIADQVNHAEEAGEEVSESVLEKHDASVELEEGLRHNKEDLYKVTYFLRVSADNLDELELRCEEITDFYSDYEMKIIRPLGDMPSLHEAFMPASTVVKKDYIHHMRLESIASLGIGATTKLGERDGIFIGWNKLTGQPVYIRPDLPAQGVKGSVTNSLATVFSGSKGGGKSMSFNIINFWAVLFGAKGIMIDPKNERGHWKTNFPFIQDYVDVINITSDEANRGLLDPFVLIDNTIEADGVRIDAQSLALDILTFLTGISIKDRTNFVPLRKAIRRVAESEQRGLLRVIDELRKDKDKISDEIADHIEIFTDYDFARLLFSDGSSSKNQKSLTVKNPLSVIQIADLVLPSEKDDKEDENPIEILSVAVMLAISTFKLSFAQSNKELFKIMGLEEAWVLTNFSKGKILVDKMVRMGRSLNTGAYFSTQQMNDLGDEDTKNNIGLRFAFKSTDKEEIKKILTFFDLDPEDEANQKMISTLENGECLFRDLYGRVGVIYIDYLFEELFEVFDTRPPMSV